MNPMPTDEKRRATMGLEAPAVGKVKDRLGALAVPPPLLEFESVGSEAAGCSL